MLNIAIIGAGFAGCYLYNRLKKLGNNITIFEKSRGTGGRLSSKNIENRFIDYGTTKFSTKDPDFIYFCNKLTKEGLLTKYENTYTPTKGINSICKSLINKDDLVTSTKIVSCYKSKNKWLLKDEENNSFKDYDLLILTIPAPQILELNIDMQNDIKSKLQLVKYNSIATLIMHSSSKFKIDESLIKSDFFKYVSDNSIKYDYDDFSSYVFHVNEQFSTSNNYRTKENLGDLIYKYIEYYQSSKLTKEINIIPHLWKYALVDVGINELEYYYSKSEELSICSDYFKTKNLEGSFVSARAFLDELI